MLRGTVSAALQRAGEHSNKARTASHRQDDFNVHVLAGHRRVYVAFGAWHNVAAISTARAQTILEVDCLRVHVSGLLAAATALFLGVAVTSCQSSRPSVPPPPRSDLWGDMKPVVSVKELMRDMLDPIADNIFDAVKTVSTKRGTVDMVPKTDADWDKIRIGGVSIAEGVYLLKVPRPFAPAGDLNNSTGPHPVELSPTQIRAKVEKDPVEWNARIEALRNVGLEVLDIVKRRDVDELWDAGFNLDQACENCHKSYWYPGEDANFYETLDRRLRDTKHTTPLPPK